MAKNKVGRPTALTQEVQSKILAAISLGSYIDVACKAAGITRQSFYHWMEKGEDDPEKNYQAAPLFRNFRAAVLEAEAVAEIRLLSQAQKGGPQSSAAMMVMSRRWRERWAETVKTEVTGKDGGPIQVEDVRQKLFDRISNLADTVKASPGDPVLN
ncbi:MAG: hypothetical protein P3T54_00150 [Dehalogenimonas sp.]|nr:hypothetical protein [Dehalogenimonas sp.]